MSDFEIPKFLQRILPSHSEDEEHEHLLQSELPKIASSAFSKTMGGTSAVLQFVRKIGEPFQATGNPFDSWKPTSRTGLFLRNSLVTTFECVALPLRLAPATVLTGVTLSAAVTAAGGLLLLGAALIPSRYPIGETLHNKALGAVAAGSESGIGALYAAVVNPVRLLGSAATIVIDPILGYDSTKRVSRRIQGLTTNRFAELQQKIVRHTRMEHALDAFIEKHGLEKIRERGPEKLKLIRAQIEKQKDANAEQAARELPGDPTAKFFEVTQKLDLVGAQESLNKYNTTKDLGYLEEAMKVVETASMQASLLKSRISDVKNPEGRTNLLKEYERLKPLTDAYNELVGLRQQILDRQALIHERRAELDKTQDSMLRELGSLTNTQNLASVHTIRQATGLASINLINGFARSLLAEYK